MRFACECGFFGLQVVRHQQAAIGGHTVAGFHQHDVARHQLAGVHINDLPVAAHPGARCQHLLERRQRALSPVLLPKPQARIQKHDDENDRCVLQVANGPGQPRCKQQHDDQKILELVNKLEPERAHRCLNQLVFAMGDQALVHVG